MDESHKFGLWINNEAIHNNDASDTILETHKFNSMRIYGNLTSNNELVILGSNSRDALDWYKIQTLTKTDKHFTNSAFDTNTFDLECKIDTPPLFLRVGNISGVNGTGVYLYYKMDKL